MKFEASQRAHHFASLLKADAVHGAFAGLTIVASMDIAVATADSLEERHSANVGYAPGVFED